MIAAIIADDNANKPYIIVTHGHCRMKGLDQNRNDDPRTIAVPGTVSPQGSARMGFLGSTPSRGSQTQSADEARLLAAFAALNRDFTCTSHNHLLLRDVSTVIYLPYVLLSPSNIVVAPAVGAVADASTYAKQRVSMRRVAAVQNWNVAFYGRAGGTCAGRSGLLGVKLCDDPAPA